MARVDFDRLAGAYDAGRSLAEPALESWLAAFAPYLESAGAPLLDVGSGTGRFAKAMADGFGVPVVGIEPSTGMRREARRNASHPQVAYVAGDAQWLPLRAGSCGAALLSTVIHHIPDLEQCARELRRVLRQDASVLIRSWFPGQGDMLLQFRYFPTSALSCATSGHMTKSLSQARHHWGAENDKALATGIADAASLDAATATGKT